MATSTAAIDMFECPVCLEPMYDARVLSCGHMLCYRCLGTQENTQWDGRPISCPYCRQKHDRLAARTIKVIAVSNYVAKQENAPQSSYASANVAVKRAITELMPGFTTERIYCKSADTDANFILSARVTCRFMSNLLTVVHGPDVMLLVYCERGWPANVEVWMYSTERDSPILCDATGAVLERVTAVGERHKTLVSSGFSYIQFGWYGSYLRVYNDGTCDMSYMNRNTNSPNSPFRGTTDQFARLAQLGRFPITEMEVYRCVPPGQQ